MPQTIVNDEEYEQKVNEFRQKALSQGFSPKEVDSEISKRKENRAALKAVSSGYPIEQLPQELRAGTFTKLVESGVTPQTKEQREEETKKKEKRTSLQGLVSTIDKLKQQTAEVNVTDIGGNIIGTNSKIKQFKTTKNLASQTIARLYEKGVLSDKDRKFYQEQVLSISPFGFQEPKVQQLDNLVSDIVTLSGFEPKDFMEEKPLGNKEEQGIASKIYDYFLKAPTGVAQDWGAGIGQIMEAPGLAQQQETGIKNAQQLIEIAKKTTDPEKQKALFRTANELMGGTKERTTQQEQQFSPDIEKNYFERALFDVALPVATMAELPGLVKGAGSLVSKTPGTVKNIAGKAANLFKTKPPAISQSSLIKGLQIANEAKATRTTLIETAQEAGKKVPGTKIFINVEKWASRAKRANPTESNTIDKFVSGAQKQLKGKKLNPTTAKELWDDAIEGFSSAGLKGSSVESSYHRLIRDSLRKELDKVAPGFEKATKSIKEGLDLEDILKSIREGTQRTEIKEALKETPAPLTKFIKGTGKRIGAGVATGLGLAAVAKALGIRFPGSAYPEE